MDGGDVRVLSRTVGFLLIGYAGGMPHTLLAATPLNQRMQFKLYGNTNKFTLRCT